MAFGLAAPFGVAGPAFAAALADPPESTAPIPIDQGRYNHMTARVFINGEGPFNFLIDTGANRSAIGEAVAERLGLPAGPPVAVNTVIGSRVRPTVMVEELRLGGRAQRRVALPTLAITGVSADGVIGVDWLRNKRLTFHFGDRRLDISGPAVGAGVDAYGGVVLPARLQSGQLSLIDTRIGSQPVSAMIDTGAQSTLGNRALQALIADRQGATPLARRVGIHTVTGERIEGDLMRIPALRLGGATFRQAPVIFADLKVFDLWGMQQQPALVLGLDLIAIFDRVTLDYSRKQVRLEVDRARGAMIARRAAGRRNDRALVSEMDGVRSVG
jgi:predicted aspartyl protease